MRKLLNLLILVFPIFLIGQSDIKLSSFFLTPITYNPAYAGSFEGINISSLYSSQWVGFDGAPKTFFLNGHGTFLNSQTGLGAEIMHDEIGITTDTKFLGNYAYHLNLNDEWKLSMGIKAGFSWYSVDYARLNIDNPFESIDLRDRISKVNFNFGVGFFLHNENFFIGLGIPNLLKTTYLDSYTNTLANSKPNYYLSSGIKWYLQDEVYLQPSVLIRLTEGAPINTLGAMTLNWEEKFYASLNVDLNSTVGAFAGFRFNNTYMIGYSYDSSITNFSRSNDGIHSFFLNIRLEDYWKRERCGCYTF